MVDAVPTMQMGNLRVRPRPNALSDTYTVGNAVVYTNNPASSGTNPASEENSDYRNIKIAIRLDSCFVGIGVVQHYLNHDVMETSYKR